MCIEHKHECLLFSSTTMLETKTNMEIGYYLRTDL